MFKKPPFFVVLIAVVFLVAALGFFGSRYWGLYKAPALTGISVISPQPNESVSSPLKVIGSVNGNGWAGFEGQVGTVSLVGEDGQTLAQGFIAATSEWTKLPTTFSAELNYISSKDQKATLIFKNENASGLPEKDREFRLPVNLVANPAGLTKVKAFFSNNNLDPEVTCVKVFPVEREVSNTLAVGMAALRELIAGPTSAERRSGYGTVINPGVVVQKLTIENGVARVDFNEELDRQVGGSCRVQAIRAQIEATLKQFPTVKEVIISINGRTQDILQP